MSRGHSFEEEMPTITIERDESRKRKTLRIDEDLVDWVNEKPNANGYINNLIRADLEYHKRKLAIEREQIIFSCQQREGLKDLSTSALQRAS